MLLQCLSILESSLSNINLLHSTSDLIYSTRQPPVILVQSYQTLHTHVSLLSAVSQPQKAPYSFFILYHSARAEQERAFLRRPRLPQPLDSSFISFTPVASFPPSTQPNVIDESRLSRMYVLVEFAFHLFLFTFSPFFQRDFIAIEKRFGS